MCRLAVAILRCTRIARHGWSFCPSICKNSSVRFTTAGSAAAAHSPAPLLTWPAFLAACILIAGAPLPAHAGAGQEAYDDFAERGLLVEGPVAKYVTTLGQRIVAASGTHRKLTFSVIDTGAVNAAAYADGHIFVFRGLLTRLQTEGQLAAVLAHELAHVTRRHVPKLMSRQRLANFGAWLLGGLSRNANIYYATQEYSMAEIAGFGRENELEADRFGARYIGQAGYDPDDMYEVITILADESAFMREIYGRPPQYHGLFASHPRSDYRRYEMIQLGAKIAEEATTDIARKAADEAPVGDFLAQVDGLAFGDLAAEGVLRGQRLYHTGFGIALDFPNGWRITNSRTVKSATAPHGSRTTIAVEVQGLDGKDMPPEKFLRKVLKLKPTEGQAFEVDEMAGYLAVLPPEVLAVPAAASDADETQGASDTEASAGDTKQSTDVTKDASTAATDSYSSRLLAVVIKDGFAYIFRGDNRLATFEQDFTAAFSHTVASFRRLRRQDLEAAITTRIALITARPEDTYEALAKEAKLGRVGADVLRLLNGDYPRGQPRASNRIKIIR